MPDTDTDGQAMAGAKVIQFPGRIRPVPEAAAPGVATPGADNAAARLDQALLVLNQALARQQEAVQAWRQNLEELTGSVGNLASSLHALDAGLEAASERLRMEPGDQATGEPM